MKAAVRIRTRMEGEQIRMMKAEENSAPVKVWIDVDTGVDDAIALMTACALEKEGKLKICGVSAVSGNVGLDRTFENTRNVLSLCGRSDIPVYPGAAHPLVVERIDAAYVHGENGLGGTQLEASAAPRETMEAWDALYRCAAEQDGELELILTGPETNAAIAFEKYPDLKTKIRRILVMGGSDVGGNITKFAEFNIYADPHAVQAVIQTGLPVVMCALDVTLKAGLDVGQVARLEESGSPAGDLFRSSMALLKKFNQGRGVDVCTVHDVCPVLYTVYPELFTGILCGVQVDTDDTETLGRTVTDRNAGTKYPLQNVFLVNGVDRNRFAEILLGLLTDDV